MLFVLGAALLSLQIASADTLATETPADAYYDEAARELVARARERREVTDRSIEAYQAIARERIALGVRALHRERSFFLHETAARVHWRRHAPGRIELLGARQAFPLVSRRVTVGDDLGKRGTHLAFDPSRVDLVSAEFGREDSSIRHPLAPGSEHHYRFRSGDTTQLRLPDGRIVRLLELQLIPRRNEFHLASGSLWLDADSHALVRALVRPARPWNLALDAEDGADVPRLVKPIRGEIRYITLEYGLWEMQWWLPRIIAFEGVAEVGVLGGGGSIRYERVYSDYRVQRTPAPMLASAADAGEAVLERCPGKQEGEAALACRCRNNRCRQFEVVVPADTASLLTSTGLPPSIYSEGATLLSDADVKQIGELLSRMQPPIWGLARPAFATDLATLDLLRYNRVEGLSIGARLRAQLGELSGDATGRLGLAELRPDLELGLARESYARRYRLAGYHRLAVIDLQQRPLGLGGSLSALLFGRDDGDYYRASGVELIGAPPRAAAQSYEWRLFAEQQREVTKNTDFSLPHLFEDTRDFRENLVAERADQIGASLRLRVNRGLDPTGLRWSAELFAEAAAGSYAYARPALTATVSAPLPGGFLGGLEVAGGSSVGDLPSQSAWYLGGSGSLRGYAPLSAEGEAFRRARAEISNPLPGARWVLFSDAGWAGGRQHVQLDPSLLSAGAGLSFLDGLLRLDLARALRGERQWRAEFYVNGTL
jgi:hypothetical protein